MSRRCPYCIKGICTAFEKPCKEIKCNTKKIKAELDERKEKCQK